VATPELRKTDSDPLTSGPDALAGNGILVA
jgi:hypothetical protein